jgi:pSer/pThr/pTyr-binding forkhead associated (FHA) protein
LIVNGLSNGNGVAAGMFKLVISDDEGKTTVVPLVRDEITIGRQEGNTIRLTERNVSRKHAKLLKANGSFLVEDLRSYNGVKVNGRRIEAQAKLAAGDQISIGDYLLALQLDAQVAPGNEVAGQATAVVANPIPHDAATAMIQAPAAHPAPPARIVMLTPPAPGAEFALSKDVIRIGRAEDLDAWVNHRSISREHAEIRHEDSVYTVVDLGSANGVRVNGRDVRNAVLQSGDVIELGQVRFRFVGVGETYVFDADRTVQMDAVEAPAPNRAPIFVGIGIIGLAVVVALLFAVVPGLFGSEEPTVTQLDDHNPHEIETNPLPPVAELNVPPTMEQESIGQLDVSALVAECHAAVSDGRLNDAMSAADRAIAAEPGNRSAADCRALVEANRADEETVARAQDQYRAGNLDDAHETITRLSDASIFRGQPPVTTIEDAWAEQHIEAGRRILAQNPADAARHARVVLASTTASEPMRNAAQDLVEQARRREGSTQVATADQAREQREAREREQREREQREREQREREQASMETEPAADPVQACAAEGFGEPMNRCIVRTVRPVGQRNLRALAMAHRGLGDRPNACRTMRLYVDRYGSTGAANEFRQYMGINCK